MNLLCSLLIASLAFASACTYENCDHQDNGSCGTACCRLVFYIQGEDTVAVMNKMNETINAGGPDGRYISMMTAEGTLTFGGKEYANSFLMCHTSIFNIYAFRVTYHNISIYLC